MSTTYTAAKILGITSAAWLSGTISALSLISIPAITDVTTTSNLSTAHTVKLWHQTFEKGKNACPPIALVSASCLSLLAYSFRNSGIKTARGLRPSALLAVAAVSTVAIVPFTIVFMGATNAKLLGYVEKAEKEGEVRESEHVDVLLKRWAMLNGVRSLLPLAGAVLAGVAIMA